MTRQPGGAVSSGSSLVHTLPKTRIFLLPLRATRLVLSWRSAWDKATRKWHEWGLMTDHTHHVSNDCKATNLFDLQWRFFASDDYHRKEHKKWMKLVERKSAAGDHVSAERGKCSQDRGSVCWITALHLLCIFVAKGCRRASRSLLAVVWSDKSTVKKRLSGTEDRLADRKKKCASLVNQLHVRSTFRRSSFEMPSARERELIRFLSSSSGCQLWWSIAHLGTSITTNPVDAKGIWSLVGGCLSIQIKSTRSLEAREMHRLLDWQIAIRRRLAVMQTRRKQLLIVLRDLFTNLYQKWINQWPM